MADVFISYSSADKAAADAVCASLENNGVSCWIAPRDIVAGSYAAAIIRAIQASKLMVLILSSHSNKSPQVEREIERAVSRDKIIYPFRIENIMPSEDLELFISSEQWMDAFEPPLESHLEKFSHNVKQLLTDLSTPVPSSGPESAITIEPRARTRSPGESTIFPSSRITISTVVAATIAAVCVIAWVMTFRVLYLTGSVYAVIGVVAQTLLLTLAGVSFLTFARARVEKLFQRLDLKRRLPGEAQIWLLLPVLALMIGVFLIVPELAARQYKRKGDEAFSKGDYSAAASNYDQVLKLSRSLDDTHFNLALAYDKSHDYDRAFQQYKLSMALAPRNFAARNNLGRLLILQQKDYGGALRQLDFLRSRLQEVPIEMHYYIFKNLGWANLELHNYSTAEQQLQWALIRRKGAAALYLLGRVYEEQGRSAEAKKQWNSFIESLQTSSKAEEEVEPDWIAHAQEQLTKGN